MFKLYKKSQDVQYAWIKKHPFQYVALNVALLIPVFLYLWYQDRKFDRELEEARTQHDL